MRILFFASGIPWIRPSGGREARIWKIAKYLAVKHEVLFVCQGDKEHSYKEEKKDNVTVRYTRGFKTGQHHIDLLFAKMWFLMDAGSRAKGFRPDVIYCSRAPLKVLHSRARKVVDCGRWWIWHWSPISLIDNLSNVLGLIKADEIIYNAEKNKKASPFKGTVINPGIDLTLFKPVECEKDIDFLYVGRLERAKGYHDFIDMPNELPISGSRRKFGVVGEGGNKVDKPNLIYFGKVPVKDMPLMYSRSKVLLVPSYGESYSQIVLEALACGTPVVAYDTIATEFFSQCKIVPKGHKFEMIIDACLDFSLNKPDPDWVKHFDEKEYLKKIEGVIDEACLRA